MKSTRNAFGVLFLLAYLLGGEARPEAAYWCDSSGCYDCGSWTESCVNGVTYYNGTCSFSYAVGDCYSISLSICDGYPFYGAMTNFSCNIVYPSDPSDWWMCEFYPGYCRVSGHADCQNTGGYCEG